MPHKDGGVASLAESTAVSLMRCPPLVRAGLCNLFRVLEMARLLSVKDIIIIISQGFQMGALMGHAASQVVMATGVLSTDLLQKGKNIIFTDYR